MSGRLPLDPSALLAPLAQFKRLALAVSGGPDSLALMLLVHEHARATDSHDRFVVYSVDHGVRPEAAAEVAFVVREAARRGFATRALRWDGEKPETGIQEAARAARYRLLAGAMREDGVEALVTAHHLSDQAETVLMRLAHGSGIEGLRGMDMFAELGDLLIVRPLLGVDPADLRAVVDRAGLVPVTDPSNDDLDYERVRWRQMLPQLATLGLDAQRLARFANRMRDVEGALVAITAEALAEVSFDEAGEAQFSRNLLRRLPRAIAARLVGQVLNRVGGGRKPHALSAVETLTDRLVREPVTTTLHGCLVRAQAETIRIRREPGREAARNRRKERTQA